MNAIHHPAESHTISTELPFADSEGHQHLVTISHDSSDRFYRILLEADISRVSLEGMNKYTILLGSRQDYVRDMTVLLGSREKELTDSILVKAIHSDHCLL